MTNRAHAGRVSSTRMRTAVGVKIGCIKQGSGHHRRGMRQCPDAYNTSEL